MPTPDTYSYVNKHVEWNGKNDNMILEELNRMKQAKNKEFIIYCDESYNLNQKDKCVEFSKKFKCVAICFNGEGIQINICGKNASNFIEKKDSISVCLEKMSPYAEKYGMIVIGNRLMDRGISFVAAGKNPYTATSIFYSKGMKTNAVSIAQRFGRITGTSNTVATTRTVFCSKKVYDDYCSYLSNQDFIYACLIDNRKRLVKDVISTIKGIKKLSRDVDRKELVKANKSYSDSCSEASSLSDKGNAKINLGKMKRLVKSWKNPENTTAIARLFREMMLNVGKITENTAKKILGTSFRALTNENHTNDWVYAFRKDNVYIYIKNEAMGYYNSI